MRFPILLSVIMGVSLSASSALAEMDDPLGGEASELAERISREYSRVLHTELARPIPVRLLPVEQFYTELALPEHSVAIYANGEIVVGVPDKGRLSRTTLERTLRHELVHAYFDTLSGGRSPAWFDEGFAQILEGRAEDSREIKLHDWLITGGAPLPLGSLTDNLHLLDPELVPIAYGQSLFAVRSLMNRRGLTAVVDYLTALRSGTADEQAFQEAFLESREHFESRLSQQLMLWARARGDQIAAE